LQVEQLARLQQLRDHRAQELLLPADPGEVRHRVARLMPRPDVRQRRRPVEVLTSGGDVQQRELVDHRVRHAHVDAAEGVDDPLKPEEVDVQDVVDLHPGDALHGSSHSLRTTAVDASLERGVDLALAHPRDVDPQISGEREEDRLLPIGARVDEDDRVRAVLSADVRVRAEGDDLLARQALAGVAPEQQVVARVLVAPARDVHRAGGAGGRRERGDVLDLPARPDVGAHDERGDHRDERGHGRGPGQEHPSDVRTRAGRLRVLGVLGRRRRVRRGHRLASGTAPFPRTRAYP
jgi:hypothetical protein